MTVGGKPVTRHPSPVTGSGATLSPLLPLWTEALLVAAAIAAAAWAIALSRRVGALTRRLAARERGGHFLAESPDTREIVRHAWDAAAEILPLARFDLYRIDASGKVDEVWRVAAPAAAAGVAEPVADPESPHLGLSIDPVRLLQLTATETDRSFAPRDLLTGSPDPRRLRLPLYSGDRLIAYLDLEAQEPIDETRRAEVRALLPSLTSSLNALRHWTIAVTDELSRLSSRRYFEARLAEEWDRRDRYGGRLAVACLDLDRFKAVNDTHGHGAGDEVIRSFGKIVRAAVRSSDVACRYGGEEFAIVFPETDASAAAAVADRIRRSLAAERFQAGGTHWKVTVSAGVAETGDAPDCKDLVFRADEALYAAKTGGRNRVVVWEPGAAARGSGSR